MIDDLWHPLAPQKAAKHTLETWRWIGKASWFYHPGAFQSFWGHYRIQHDMPSPQLAREFVVSYFHLYKDQLFSGSGSNCQLGDRRINFVGVGDLDDHAVGSGMVSNYLDYSLLVVGRSLLLASGSNSRQIWHNGWNSFVASCYQIKENQRRHVSLRQLLCWF